MLTIVKALNNLECVASTSRPAFREIEFGTNVSWLVLHVYKLCAVSTHPHSARQASSGPNEVCIPGPVERRRRLRRIQYLINPHVGHSQTGMTSHEHILKKKRKGPPSFCHTTSYRFETLS